MQSHGEAAYSATAMSCRLILHAEIRPLGAGPSCAGGANAELKAALRRLIGACVRPNGMLQPTDVDSEYAARAAIAAPDGQKEK